MDAPTRLRLDALKDRQRRRRARGEDGAYLRPLIPRLRADRIRGCRLSPAGVRAALGVLADGPGCDERIDWSQVPHAVCRVWPDAAERTARLREALDACCGPEDRVVVIWHTGAAGLRLRARDLVRVADPVLDAAPEVWICAAVPGRWLIECSGFDREICHATSMGG